MLPVTQAHCPSEAFFSISGSSQPRHQARDAQERGELAGERVLAAANRLEVEARRRRLAGQQQLLDIGQLRPDALQASFSPPHPLLYSTLARAISATPPRNSPPLTIHEGTLIATPVIQGEGLAPASSRWHPHRNP